MPTYWETDSELRHDGGLELGQQPFAAVGARSAMCGMVVKVTLITFGLVASYYGSIAATVPTPSQQGLEVSAAATLSTDPPRKSNEAQQAFRAHPTPTASVKRHQPRAIRCSDRMRVVSESSASPPSTDVDEELALWPQPRSVNWRGQGNVSWALARDFEMLIAKPLPLAPQPLLASASRICGLLWRPAQYSSETTILSSIAIVVVSEDSTETSKTYDLNDASGRRSAAREQRASADPVYGGWLPKLLPREAEAYTIEISSSSPVQAKLTARTVAGALNGLETFAQLFTGGSPLLHTPAHLMPEQNSNSSSRSSSNGSSPSNSGAGITDKAATTGVENGGGDLAKSPSLRIEDAPAVAWRGMMADVARHFLPVPLLVSTLDAMKAVKLNVLHLHLTDAQSFPLVLETNPADFTAAGRSPSEGVFTAAGPLFPPRTREELASGNAFYVNITELGRQGAFQRAPNNRRRHQQEGHGPSSSVSDAVYGYTAADLSLLVREASLRGIRVVPEVDVPAHTLSWGKAYPDIVVQCAHKTAEAQSPSDVPALNPSKAMTYEVVFAVLAAVAKVFPDEYLHLGADEVRLPCWEEDSDLMAWAKDKGLSGARGLFDYFETRAIAMATQLNRTAVLWQGALDQQLALPGPYFKDRAPLVEPWKCWSGMNTAAAATGVARGFGVIDASCWYLDWPTPWTNNLKADFVLPPQQRRLSTRNQRLTSSSEEAEIRALQVAVPRLLKHPPWRHRSPPFQFTRRRLGLGASTAATTAKDATLANTTAQGLAPLETAAHTTNNSSAPRQALREETGQSTSAAKTPPKGDLVGGETAMWTESVDWTNFECRVWPRAAAVAERLWRGPATETPEDSLQRFRVLTTLLQSRGVGAAPVDDAVDGSSGGQQCPPLAPHLQRPLPPLHSKVSDSNGGSDRNIAGHDEGLLGTFEMKGLSDTASVSAPNEEAADLNDINASEILPWLFGEEDRVAPMADDSNDNDGQAGINDDDDDDDDGGPIPESFVSPVSSDVVDEVTHGVSVVQLNADDGGGGSLTRMAAIDSWLQNMALGHTNNDTALGGAALPFPAIAVGMCELNGWAKLDHGYLDHHHQALTPTIVSKAAAAGFAHAHVWTPPGHPYALGVAARSPLRVRHEWGPKEGFERGLLHVQLPLEPGYDGRGAVDARGEAVWPPSAQRSFVEKEGGTPARKRGLDLLIVHLAPHDSGQRLEEAHMVAGLIQRLTSEGRPALVMGDFNTLSRWDAPQHEKSGLLEWISNGTVAHAVGSRNQKHFNRLARKYTTEVAENTLTPAASIARTKKLQLAYGPMDTLLNVSKGGLTDLCALQCRHSRSASDVTYTGTMAAHDTGSNSFSAFTAAHDPSVQECLQRLCRATEPTLLLPDRAELPPGVAAPPIRVDFLLANGPFLEGVAGSLPPLAETLINSHTSTMSDHYPIRVQWTSKSNDADVDMK